MDTQTFLTNGEERWRIAILNPKSQLAAQRFGTPSGPTARPPYRATGYRYAYCTYGFQVSQGIALCPPKFVPSQPRGEVAEGVAAQAALWRVLRYTGVSPIAV